MRPSKPVGIVGWGAYIPRYRLKAEEIARVWNGGMNNMAKALRIEMKSVPSYDEDMITIAVEAATNAIKRFKLSPNRIGCIFVGSESKPYAVKPGSTIVAEAVGATPQVLAADYEFACKAGTEALQTTIGLVSSGMVEYGMAIGSDTAQGEPGDDLDYTASAGGAAYIVGSNKSEFAAEIIETYSYVTDTIDFWRRAEQPYPSHGRTFTKDPAYMRHIIEASKGLMEAMGTRPEDYDYAVFHQPNGKFPVKVACKLGFSIAQVKESIVVDRIGNTYSGSALLGLARILDIAKPGDRILFCSFGSGAGSDAIHIEVKDGIEEKKNLAPKVDDYIDDFVAVDYTTYLKYRGMIRFNER